MDQTTSRLRKTFHYPDDNDSEDSLPEVLDEQEQETLIRTLHHENTTRNTQYTQILLAVPLVCTIPYVPTLFYHRTALLSLLSISSLISTAYLLYIFPPGVTAIPVLDSLNSRPSTKSSRSASSAGSSHYFLPLQQEALRAQHRGPIATYLPYLNMGLCVLLAVAGSVAGSKEDRFWWGFELLPVGVYGVVLVAKVVMGGVDPQAELDGLRYGFKGA